MVLVRNASFLIVKNSCVREELIDLTFFSRHNFNRSLCKNIFLVSSHSRYLPLVRAHPQLTLPPSPTNFRLCPFLSTSPSTEAPLERLTSWIILAEEGVPIFDSHICFSPLTIYFGTEKLKCIFLSSSSVLSLSSTKWLKTQ